MKFDDEVDKDLNPIPIHKQKNMACTQSDMVEDYLVNPYTSVIYLSLAYHRTYPNYVRGRLSDLYNRKRNNKRILLVKHDFEDENNVINQIYIECAKFDTTCIVCWADDEAAQYLHTFKSYERKSDNIL
jgi:DNA excision repair protein ERCC-1